MRTLLDLSPTILSAGCCKNEGILGSKFFIIESIFLNLDFDLVRLFLDLDLDLICLDLERLLSRDLDLLPRDLDLRAPRDRDLLVLDFDLDRRARVLDTDRRPRDRERRRGDLDLLLDRDRLLDDRSGDLTLLDREASAAGDLVLLETSVDLFFSWVLTAAILLLAASMALKAPSSTMRSLIWAEGASGRAVDPCRRIGGGGGIPDIKDKQISK